MHHGRVVTRACVQVCELAPAAARARVAHAMAQLAKLRPLDDAAHVRAAPTRQTCRALLHTASTCRALTCCFRCVCVCAPKTMQALLGQLTEDVASEDPRNGSLLVSLVDQPYVVQGDPELASWVL